MLSFLNQPLLWGLAVVGVPLIIHLINLLRHRRVKWAAMEFLLAGQRKHSTWIKLKEMLLLLMRMAAIAAVVLVVARPRLDGGIGRKLGDVTTHHVVLLDDSFSMGDRFAERNVFDVAKAAVERIAQQALEESSNQTFTLLRTSQAAASAGAPSPTSCRKPSTRSSCFATGLIASSIACWKRSPSPKRHSGRKRRSSRSRPC
ncbi:MAG: BatA domain-containing protein [Pirellulales bacterium]